MERIHLYFAELSDAPHAQDQDPDENVYPVVMSFDEVEDAVRKGSIFDATYDDILEGCTAMLTALSTLGGPNPADGKIVA